MILFFLDYYSSISQQGKRHFFSTNATGGKNPMRNIVLSGIAALFYAVNTVVEMIVLMIVSKDALAMAGGSGGQNYKDLTARMTDIKGPGRREDHLAALRGDGGIALRTCEEVDGMKSPVNSVAKPGRGIACQKANTDAADDSANHQN